MEYEKQFDMKLRQARKNIKRFYEFLHKDEQNIKEFYTLKHKYDRATIVVSHYSPSGREANRYCQRFSALLRRSKKLCKLKAENKIQ